MTLLLPGTDIDITLLPKVSLHDHLDGGLRPATIVDLAPSHELELPTTDPAELSAWFAAQSDSGSLVEYLKTFDITTGVMQTAEALQRIAKEFVLDLADDGVIYGEIRWAPEQHLKRGLTLDETVEAVQLGLDEGVAEVRASGRAITVGQLVSAMRHLDRGEEIAQLALRHRDRGVVGFDIAGPEAGFPPSRLRGAFDLLFAAHLPATVHAGEADGPASIQSALTDGRALRLGHGVRIREDLEVTVTEEGTSVVMGSLAQWVRDRQIVLETSPSSNVQTGAIAAWGKTMADHPFDLLYRLGFSVTVNTDNRLMSQTTLSRELALLAETFGYDLEDLLTFQITAAHASFLPLEERDALIDALIRGFDEA